MQYPIFCTLDRFKFPMTEEQKQPENIDENLENLEAAMEKFARSSGLCP